MTKTKQENKKRFLVILLVVLLLALAVGYAAFSDTLTITGTANVNGTFDVKFTSASVASSAGCTATAEIVDQTAAEGGNNVDDDKLVVTVTDLAYPGAGAQIHAVITNAGTIPVSITNVSTPTPTGNGNAIKISGLEQITTSHPVIEPNGTCTVDFTIYWDSNVTTLNASNAGEDIEDATNKYEFTFTITYEQATTAFTGTPAHTDVNPATPTPGN